nr:TPA: cytochrome c oxidase subunit II [Triannulata magna]
MYIPYWNGIMFQDPYSKTMNMIYNMHDWYMVLLTLITTLVFSLIITIFMNKKTNRSMYSNEKMENLWIVMPFMTLCSVIYPSMNTLFLNEEYSMADITVKVIGHQWYWSYEYTNFNIEPFDSYMINTQDLSETDFRLLEVDNRLIIPYGMTTQLLVTASDVIHSWAMPSLGLKVDAVPGRLNQALFTPTIMGLLYGQCSELCGVNHSFMPITLEIINPKFFMNWMSEKNWNFS